MKNTKKTKLSFAVQEKQSFPHFHIPILIAAHCKCLCFHFAKIPYEDRRGVR